MKKILEKLRCFTLNQNAQDLMMNAPSDISDEQLKELNLKVKKKKLIIFYL